MTEQQLINILHFILRNVFGNFMYFVFITGLLTPKYNKWLTITVLTFLSTIMYCIVEDMSAYVNFASLAVFMTIAAFTLYKDKKRYCIFAIAYFFVNIIILDMLISALMLNIYGYYPGKSDIIGWSAVISTLIFNINCLILINFSILLWNKLMRKQNIKSMGMFLLFPLSQVFFIATFVKGTWENNALYLYNEPLLIISIILSAVADVVMYIALRDNSNMNTMRKRLAEINREMEQQLKYYDAIAEKYTEIREYRHDILNLVSTSEIMLEKKLSENESKAYIDELKKKSEAMEIPIYCNNPLVNAVLWQKQGAAEKQGIIFSTDIEASEDFPTDRIDICSLMVNLVDNALRECENCEDPFIEIEANRKINMLFISVRNSCKSLNHLKTQRLATTKNGDHGYGMEIINRIAEKYNGYFSFTAENGVANASVMLEIT